MTPEQPPKGEHQANGVADEAGRIVRGQAHVLKLQMEAHKPNCCAREDNHALAHKVGGDVRALVPGGEGWLEFRLETQGVDV